MNIQHSSRSDEWFTPLPILVAAKKVLGPIELDPASNAIANARVGARYFFTKEMDGLSIDWNCYGAIFCNPPGGKTKNRSNTELFWQKLIVTSDFTHAIFLCFSLEAAQTTQRDGKGGVLRFPFCVPAKRLAFDASNGLPGPAPSHSNVIVYVPGTIDKRELFFSTFSEFGFGR